MGAAKIAITMEENTLKKLDRLVRSNAFANRSKAIQAAVEEKLVRMDKSRLAIACAKLDPKYEQAMADEGLSEDSESWPEY